MLAIRNNQAEIVRTLLNIVGINVNQQDSRSWTALIFASWIGHLEIVEGILQYGDEGQSINVNHASTEGLTALMLASICGHLDVARVLLARPDIDVDRTDPNGHTALHYAAGSEHRIKKAVFLSRFLYDGSVFSFRSLPYLEASSGSLV